MSLPSLSEDAAAYSAPLCEPIAGASATGEDLSYDAEFGEVKQEIDKLVSITEGQPNWSMVVVVGEQILRNRSKDFRLLVWIAIAKFHTNGIPGLILGLGLLRDCSVKFWDDMHPSLKRKRARANLLGWLSEQAAAKLGSYEQHNLKASDAEPLGAIETIYTELDSFYREKLAELYPGMGTLRTIAREKLRLIPEPKKPDPPPAAVPATASPDAAVPAAAAPSAATVATPAVTISGPEDADKAVNALGKNLRDIASVLRHADPAQATAYRLHRAGLWLSVKQAPPVQDGRSRLPAPGADDKKRLERLQSGRQWVDLIEAAEALTGQYRFWLDPHRLIDQAMEQLGALFLQARETVAAEVAAFCARVPDIARGKFTDGMPFADAATESWLEQHALGKGGGASSATVSEEDQEIARRFEEARELVKQGRLPEGLGLATGLAARGPDARTRFKSRLEIAEMAVLGGQPKVGLAILGSLALEADLHRLEEWEPGLCAALYSTQVAGLRALDPKERISEEEKALFAKLSRLDPASALRLTGG